MTDREALAKDARHEGSEARRIGLAIETNPHPIGTLEYGCWVQGWAMRSAEIRRAEAKAREKEDDLWEPTQGNAIPLPGVPR